MLHGCAQSAVQVGTDFMQQSGYLAWAEANDIVLAFPQTVPVAHVDCKTASRESKSIGPPNLCMSTPECISGPNFYLGGNSGISGLFSGYAPFDISFCPEPRCFANVFWIFISGKSLLSVSFYCYGVCFTCKSEEKPRRDFPVK